MQGINSQIKEIKRVVFADGEDENTLKLRLLLKKWFWYTNFSCERESC